MTDWKPGPVKLKGGYDAVILGVIPEPRADVKYVGYMTNENGCHRPLRWSDKGYRWPVRWNCYGSERNDDLDLVPPERHRWGNVFPCPGNKDLSEFTAVWYDDKDKAMSQFGPVFRLHETVRGDAASYEIVEDNR